MRDQRDAGHLAELRKVLARVAVKWLLDEGDAELLELRHGLHRLGVGPAFVRVDSDRHAVVERLAHRPHALQVAGELETGLDLDVAKAATGQLVRHLGRALRRTADDELDLDGIADAAAPDLVERQLRRLADDVPKRHLHRRLRLLVEGDRRIHALRRVLDGERIPANQRGRQVFGDAVAAASEVLAGPQILGGRFADADDVVIRRDDRDAMADRRRRAVGSRDHRLLEARHLDGGWPNFFDLYIVLLSFTALPPPGSF